MRTGINAKEFTELYLTRYAQLHALALTFLHDDEACRDVVSDIFATIWDTRSQLNPAQINSYLYASTRNRCIAILRREKAHQRYAEDCRPDVILYEDMEVADERMSILIRQIGQMPQRIRFVLSERYDRNQSYAEVAATLGITTNGVKKIISRTFVKLRSAVSASVRPVPCLNSAKNALGP